jgi:hypothetical protein
MKIRRTTNGKVRGRQVLKKTSAAKDRDGAKTRILIIRSWWVLRGVAVGCFLLVLFYAVYVGAGNLIALPSLALRTIHVEGCREVDSKIMVRISGVRIGQAILKVDLKEVRDRVIRHPIVKDAAVVRELPDTLRITIEERTPVAAVMDREFALLDMDGVVLSHPAAYTDGFPIITGIKSVPEEGKVALEALPTLEAMRDLIASGFLSADRISELRARGDRLLVSLTGSGTLLILPRDDVRTALIKLTRLMEKGLFDAGAPGYDLRFPGRIVVMPEKTASGGGKRSISLAGG